VDVEPVDSVLVSVPPVVWGTSSVAAVPIVGNTSRVSIAQTMVLIVI
jgi:hypothetical protein